MLYFVQWCHNNNETEAFHNRRERNCVLDACVYRGRGTVTLSSFFLSLAVFFFFFSFFSTTVIHFYFLLFHAHITSAYYAIEVYTLSNVHLLSLEQKKNKNKKNYNLRMNLLYTQFKILLNRWIIYDQCRLIKS